MHILFSLLYAPFVFISLQYFDLKIVSGVIFVISIIWFLVAFKNSLKKVLFPTFYVIVSLCAFLLDDFMLLKSLPLLISILVSLYFFYSYFTKTSFILLILEKFKKTVDTKEKVYIQNSTFFWAIVSLVNISLHLFVLYNDNITYWIIYTSVGWYFVFLGAFIIQMLHRQFYFKGVKNV